MAGTLVMENQRKFSFRFSVSSLSSSNFKEIRVSHTSIGFRLFDFPTVMLYPKRFRKGACNWKYKGGKTCIFTMALEKLLNLSESSFLQISLVSTVAVPPCVLAACRLSLKEEILQVLRTDEEKIDIKRPVDLYRGEDVFATVNIKITISTETPKSSIATPETGTSGFDLPSASSRMVCYHQLPNKERLSSGDCPQYGEVGRQDNDVRCNDCVVVWPNGYVEEEGGPVETGESYPPLPTGRIPTEPQGLIYHHLPSEGFPLLRALLRELNKIGLQSGKMEEGENAIQPVSRVTVKDQCLQTDPEVSALERSELLEDASLIKVNDETPLKDKENKMEHLQVGTSVCSNRNSSDQHSSSQSVTKSAAPSESSNTQPNESIGCIDSRGPANNRDSPLSNRDSPLSSRDSPLSNRDSPLKCRDSPLSNRDSPLSSRDKPLSNAANLSSVPDPKLSPHASDSSRYHSSGQNGRLSYQLDNTQSHNTLPDRGQPDSVQNENLKMNFSLDSLEGHSAVDQSDPQQEMAACSEGLYSEDFEESHEASISTPRSTSESCSVSSTPSRRTSGGGSEEEVVTDISSVSSFHKQLFDKVPPLASAVNLGYTC